MVSIRLDNVGLIYPVRQKLTMSRPDARLPRPGGRITDTGRLRHVTALDAISFALRAGARLGLVGPPGAGKTTMHKVLYGIFRPTSGTLDVEGRRDAMFNISLGFRREATGRRNIELRGLINGWTPNEIAGRMEQIIEFSELGDFIDMPFKSYSQGMSARLAFSIATSFEPEIMLMDEWLGAGDTDFQQKARQRMAEMAQRAGIIVLASHNRSLLQRTCNRILELEHGRLVQLVPVEEWEGER
jgi:ABC-type polysaccharide/polyol phosphate transport system ATPase subunit